MTDLDKLIEAVEAGRIGDDWMPWIDVMDRTRGRLPYRFKHMPAAYNGSLDAAKRLHDALLPGWDYLISANDAEIWPTGAYPQTTAAQVVDNPARSWLLAILRAVKAKGERG